MMARWSGLVAVADGLTSALSTPDECARIQRMPACLPPAPPISVEVSIDDLADIVTPSHAFPTTERLGSCVGLAMSAREDAGVRITTSCVSGSCVDGAADGASGRTLLAPTLNADDRDVVRGGGGVERVVRVAFATPEYVSLYVAETTMSPGAAHANNSLTCRTFDRHSGRELRLGDILTAPGARRVVAAAQALNDDETALERLDATLPRHVTFSDVSFRWGSGHGDEPQLILCGERWNTSEVTELPIDQLGVLHLLSRADR
jgi:hypothetical protein